MNNPSLEYVGFWPRVGASIVDSILLLMVITPIALWVYGADYWTDTRLIKGLPGLLIEYILPAVAVIAFWLNRQATPGKMLIGAQIVDAATGAPLSLQQALLRYLGYYLAMLPLFLGLLWVAFDPRKQGWHDKLAGTVVVRNKQRVQAVSFPQQR